MIHDIRRSGRSGLTQVMVVLTMTVAVLATSCTDDNGGEGGGSGQGDSGQGDVAANGASPFDELVAAGSADEACATLPIEVIHGLAGSDTLVLTARQSTEGVACSYSDPGSFEAGYGWFYNLDRTPSQQLELDLPLAGDPTPEPLPDFGEDAYLINFVTLDFWAAVAPLANSTIITNAANKEQAVDLLSALVSEIS